MQNEYFSYIDILLCIYEKVFILVFSVDTTLNSYYCFL
jgi:hypothetical protein